MVKNMNWGIDTNKLDAKVNYVENLENSKSEYPFEFWLSLHNKGLGKYSAENCFEVRSIFDSLIEKLQNLTPDSSDAVKLEEFRKAVLQLNNVRQHKPYLIETIEREEFCELIDIIGSAAGLNVDEISNGQDLASLWRTW